MSTQRCKKSNKKLLKYLSSNNSHSTNICYIPNNILTTKNAISIGNIKHLKMNNFISWGFQQNVHYINFNHKILCCKNKTVCSHGYIIFQRKEHNNLRYTWKN